MVRLPAINSARKNTIIDDIELSTDHRRFKFMTQHFADTIIVLDTADRIIVQHTRHEHEVETTWYHVSFSVGEMIPGMAKSSSGRPRSISRIKKRCHGSKDKKKTT
jgi:hypothetical protein